MLLFWRSTAFSSTRMIGSIIIFLTTLNQGTTRTFSFIFVENNSHGSGWEKLKPKPKLNGNDLTALVNFHSISQNELWIYESSLPSIEYIAMWFIHFSRVNPFTHWNWWLYCTSIYQKRINALVFHLHKICKWCGLGFCRCVQI